MAIGKEDWSKVSATSIFRNGGKEDSGSSGLLRLTSIPGMMEQLILEAISKHMRNKKLISQHRFTKGKSFLASLITFYDKITVLVEEMSS